MVLLQRGKGFFGIADLGMRIADWGFGIADCGLQYADCGLAQGTFGVKDDRQIEIIQSRNFKPQHTSLHLFSARPLLHQGYRAKKTNPFFLYNTVIAGTICFHLLYSGSFKTK